MTEKGQTPDGEKRSVHLSEFIGMWPTPVAQDDNKSPEAHLAMKQRMGERDGSNANRTAITSLNVMSQLWSTPRASPNENRQTQASPSQQAGEHGMNLATQANALNLWQTPGVSRGSERGQDRKDELRLAGQAALFPNFPPAPVILTPGGPSLPSGPTSPPPSGSPASACSGSPGGSLRPGRKRRGKALNPEFVTWLMGFPEGWINLEH